MLSVPVPPLLTSTNWCAVLPARTWPKSMLERLNRTAGSVSNVKTICKLEGTKPPPPPKLSSIV